MALLRHVATGREAALRGRSLVGRSPRADLRLAGEGASMEHAVIHWDGAQWSVRDLTSRNGTRINDNLLIGQTWRLVVGDRLTFGDPKELWRWINGAPPCAVAIRSDGVVIEAADGLLLLPDEQRPQASLCLQDNRWELDVDGHTRPVDNGEALKVGDYLFKLDLPSLDPNADRTLTVSAERCVSTARIRFRVSRDEEHVSVTFEIGGVTKELRSRSFHYMLLLLARARLDDAHASVPADDAGWIYAQDLARQLGTSVEHLNVDVYRARRAVQEVHLFDDAHDVIQRRRTTTQIRLGIGDIVMM